jgi:anaerobic selenocysteine-containing dehydrogenase
VVFLNRQDLAARDLQADDLVDLVSEFAGQTRLAQRWYVVPYDIPRGCAAAYFPEANALVSIDAHAEHSETPASKSIPIRIRRHAPETRQ